MRLSHLLYLFCFLSHFAHADITYRNGHCFIEDGQIYLSQAYDITLAEEPVNALKSGIVFYFVFDITLDEDDSWFATSHQLQRERILRYDHISRQFIVEDPVTLIQQGFINVDAALEVLGNIEHMAIANTNLLNAEAKPVLNSQLRLNLDKLPVSLRLSTLLDQDWTLKSESWTCQPSA
ncbi:DUF4390 domain-containing protein [Cardiobacteriaceae bacterium TAE3-ERU3]|nr:DUF4390 domain-containing protein [Cardiobacteriaceae bacterium TAE3-ERU3]